MYQCFHVVCLGTGSSSTRTNVDSMLLSPVPLIKRVQGMIEAFIYSLSDSSDFSLYIHGGALLSGAVKIIYYRPGG